MAGRNDDFQRDEAVRYTTRATLNRLFRGRTHNLSGVLPASRYVCRPEPDELEELIAQHTTRVERKEELPYYWNAKP